MKKLNNQKTAIILGIVCMLLTYFMMMQFKTVGTFNTTVSRSAAENKLRDEVLKWKERYEIAYENLEEAEEILEGARKRTTENDASSSAIEEELKLSNRLLGLTELTGKGVIITLEDSKLLTTIGEGNPGQDSMANINVSDYIIHDDDLISVISELRNAGVDAISVNDQRIVSTSGIVCDGSVVRINRTKVGVPYVIRAIGSPERIVGALNMYGGYMDILRQAGISVDIKKSNTVTVPKYNGVMDAEYIRSL